MDGFLLKAMAMSALAVLFISKSDFCASLPNSEFAVYQAMISEMPDQVIVLKYQDEFDRLRNTFKETTKDAGDMAISQLPVFKIAVFKAMMNELKKRQAKTNKNLLTPEQVSSGNALIREKEGGYRH